MNELPKPYQKWHARYEQEYATDGLIWGEFAGLTKPFENMLAPKSTILDLGAGEGRHAIYLAQQGHLVTAVDFSETGLKKAEQRAAENNVTIETTIANIADRSFLNRLGNYDVIIAANSLQFLTPEDADHVLQVMKEKTNPQGYIAISSFRGVSPAYKRYHDNELKHLFSDWDEIYYNEGTRRTTLDNKEILFVDIIARKKGGPDGI